MDAFDYCERTSHSLIAEPINLITNLAFIISAALLFNYTRKQSVPPRIGDYGLILNLFAIGVGSALFHSFANFLTEMMDVIPILTFQLVWLWHYFSRIFGFSFWLKVLLLVVYFVANMLIPMLPMPDPDPTNGSMAYGGSLLVMLVLSFHYRSVSNHSPNLLLTMTGVFILSLTLRTIDKNICGSFGLGTHFFWHCLNAVVLWGCSICVLNKEG